MWRLLNVELRATEEAVVEGLKQNLCVQPEDDDFFLVEVEIGKYFTSHA